MEKQPNSRTCFVCGIESPIGLNLRFYTDEEGRCIARFRPKLEHQGYPGHLHETVEEDYPVSKMAFNFLRSLAFWRPSIPFRMGMRRLMRTFRFTCVSSVNRLPSPSGSMR